MDTLVTPFSEPNAILKNNKNIFKRKTTLVAYNNFEHSPSNTI